MSVTFVLHLNQFHFKLFSMYHAMLMNQDNPKRLILSYQKVDITYFFSFFGKIYMSSISIYESVCLSVCVSF